MGSRLPSPGTSTRRSAPSAASTVRQRRPPSARWALKAVRQAMIDADLCRNEINKRIGKVVRMFKWGVAEEIIPGEVHQALTRRHRTTEGAGRRPRIGARPSGAGRLRRRHPPACLPAGLGDGRAAAPDRDEARRGLHDACPGPGRGGIGPGPIDPPATRPSIMDETAPSISGRRPRRYSSPGSRLTSRLGCSARRRPRRADWRR